MRTCRISAGAAVAWLAVISSASAQIETLFDTGPHEPANVDGVLVNVAFASGTCIPNCESGPRRITAQAFRLPAPPPETIWRVTEIAAEGFEPGAGELNESLNVEIFHRTAHAAPGVADSLYEESVPRGRVAVEQGRFLVPVNVRLPEGDYWLTVWAANDRGVTASLAWYLNAPDGINVVCPKVACVGPPQCDGADVSTAGSACDPDACADTAGQPMMWRACAWPPGPSDPGFGSEIGGPPPAPLQGGGPDPMDRFNAAFAVRGLAVAACPWDCGPADGVVDTRDLLASLAAWAVAGDPCDFIGPPGVGLEEVQAVLANWGSCP